jgi:putative ABC transport system permease protein
LDLVNVISRYVSLIIGASLILIIIYINVLNRKKEIGILKAIGISPNSIVLGYAILSALYVLFGICAGLLLYFLLIFYFTTNPVIFYESIEIIPEIQWLLIIQSISAMLIMSVIAGIIPAWSVTKEKMIEAIWGR